MVISSITQTSKVITFTHIMAQIFAQSYNISRIFSFTERCKKVRPNLNRHRLKLCSLRLKGGKMHGLYTVANFCFFTLQKSFQNISLFLLQGLIHLSRNQTLSAIFCYSFKNFELLPHYFIFILRVHFSIFLELFSSSGFFYHHRIFYSVLLRFFANIQ